MSYQTVENHRRLRPRERVCIPGFPICSFYELTDVTRKGKPVGNTFGEGFFWTEIADAAADVYRGVRSSA